MTDAERFEEALGRIKDDELRDTFRVWANTLGSLRIERLTKKGVGRHIERSCNDDDLS